LVHEGKRILQALERLEHRVKRIDAGWESEFRMVLDEMFPFTKLLPHLAAFKTSYPATQLKLSYSEPTGCALEAVLNGRADLAIESLDAPPGIDGLATAPLGRLALAFVAAPGQRPASRPDAMGHDIGVQNCIIALHPGLARLPGQPLASVQERDILYVPDIKTKLEALLNGLGAGFIPEYMARPYIESGQLIERKTRFLPMHRQYSLIWRSDDHGKALHWWLEHIKQVNIGQNHPAESANNEFHRILRSS
jgi:DNA-binding transcriptional LysR family regulator